MTARMRTDSAPNPRGASRGHALVIQIVILLVIAGMIALPVYLIARAKTARKYRIVDEIVTLVNESNDVKDRLVKAFDRIGGTIRRLPYAESLKRDYSDEFAKLFRRYYSARKGLDRGEDHPTADELVALKRDFEEYKRRLDNQYGRLSVLEEIADIAEQAVVLARHYQGGIRVVRDCAPFGPNRFALPQLEEADRQLGTAMSFVLSGIDKFQEDLRGTDTPILIKTGIEQIRKVTHDVDALLAGIEGGESVRISRPSLGTLTLAEYLARFREESAKIELPPLPDRVPPAPRKPGGSGPP